MGFSYYAALFRGLKVTVDQEEVTEPGCSHGYPGEFATGKYCSLCGKPHLIKRSRKRVDIYALCDPEDDPPNRWGEVTGDPVYHGFNVVGRESSREILIGDVIARVDPRCDDDLKLNYPEELRDELHKLAHQVKKDGFKVVDSGLFLICIAH